MTHFKCLFYAIVFLLGLRVMAADGPIDHSIAAFDQNQLVSNANAVFDLLNKEQFTEEPIHFSSSAPLDSVRQQVWYWAAEWYYDKNQYDRARRYASKALPLYRSNSEGKADCLNLLGCIYVRLGDFRNAAINAKQCLTIDLSSGDHDRISSSMNTLAGIYMAAKQSDEAEKWILQAIDHADKANNPVRKATLLGMASEVYHTLSREQLALDYAQQSYDLETKLGRQLQAAIRLDQKSSALMGLKRYDEAEKALRTAIAVMREHGDAHSLAIACNHLGTALIWQKREAEAYPCYQEAADLFVKMGDPFNELYARRGLCLSLWESHPDRARAELNRFNFLKDSLYTHDANEVLARLNAEFGNDKLQQEIDSERNAHIRDIIIAAIIFLGLVAAIWYVYKRRSRAHMRHINNLVREVSRLRLALAATDAPPIADPSAQMDDNELQRRIIQCVNDDNDGTSSLESIADSLSMSASTLRRRMQRITGESPKTYIQAILMDKARRLLDQGNAVADVAQACGYSDNSSFTRAFKRVFGETPTQYRSRPQCTSNA